MIFEKLGSFYLGKEYDLGSKQLLDRPFAYDARDMTTHAVCVGMTGSGKTGLCVDLLEEAALDQVPAIIIDPKGDITNLLLTFPELRPQDFRPWINSDDARRAGQSEDQFAAAQAEMWRKGLAEWGQDGNRIRALREAADFALFTPGSEAGIPVSILQSFARPALSWDTEAEHLRERIQGAVSALLGLVGLEADPLRSREHILLSSIFEHSWRAGMDLSLASLIMAVQNPPVRRLGVFDIETFYPEKDRFELAMSLNNIMAAPGFQTWLEGQEMNIPGFLASPEGKCRHSIFYIAHLSEAERMFFVTILLNQLISWMRTQPGTNSLRAMLYMDEIFGFFPPVSNPPSKKPLLTILKQARAYGIGAVLTTQNPVDLDYKGLSNAGTWFIGRLQTERDRMRLVEGLKSASPMADQHLDGKALSDEISGLGKRVFIQHNVHDKAPVVFQTRWAMSYLRGPLTRSQIKLLTDGRTPDSAVSTPLEETGIAPRRDASPGAIPQPPPPSEADVQVPRRSAVPQLPRGIRQSFLPPRLDGQRAALEVESESGGSIEILDRTLLYKPVVLGSGQVHFVNRKRGVDEKEDFTLFSTPPTRLGSLRWEEAEHLELGPSDLMEKPAPGAVLGDLPESVNEAKEMKILEKSLADHLYRSSSLTLLHSPVLKLYSLPREEERDFRLRLQQQARERRDEDVDKLERRYRKRIVKLENRLRRAQAVMEKKAVTASAKKKETMVSLGESLLGMFMGRRSIRMASTTLSKYRQSRTAGMDIGQAEEAIAAVERERAALEEELQGKSENVTERWDEALEKIEKVPVAPRRTDIIISFFGLAWIPSWVISFRDSGGTERTDTIRAF